MRFGINTFLFACPFTNESTRLFPRFKRWGFDTVEISIEQFNHIDPAYLRDRLHEHGLACGSVAPRMGPDKDLRGEPRQQQAGGRFLQRGVDRMGGFEAPPKAGGGYFLWGRAAALPPGGNPPTWGTPVKE